MELYTRPYSTLEVICRCSTLRRWMWLADRCNISGMAHGTRLSIGWLVEGGDDIYAGCANFHCSFSTSFALSLATFSGQSQYAGAEGRRYRDERIPKIESKPWIWGERLSLNFFWPGLNSPRSNLKQLGWCCRHKNDKVGFYWTSDRTNVSLTRAKASVLAYPRPPYVSPTVYLRLERA